MENEEASVVGLSISMSQKIESGAVVDSTVHRLFLVGWDVPTSCVQFPVPSGVRR